MDECGEPKETNSGTAETPKPISLRKATEELIFAIEVYDASEEPTTEDIEQLHDSIAKARVAIGKEKEELTGERTANARRISGCVY